MRRVVSAIAWGVAGRGGQAVILILLTIFVSRLVSADDFGQFLLLINAAGLLAIVARCGLDQTALRFVAKVAHGGGVGAAFGYGRRLIRIGMGISLIFFMVVALAVVVVAPPLSQLYGISYAAALAGLGLGCAYAVQSIAVESFRGLARFRAAVVADRGIGLLCALPVLALLYVSGASITVNTIMWTLTVMMLVVTFAAVARGPKPQRLEDEEGIPTTTSSLLAYGSPIVLLQATIYLVTQSDIWIVGAFLSGEEVAYYGAASRLAITIGLSLAIVNAVIPPLLARLDNSQGRDQLGSLLGGTAFVAFLPSLFLFVAFLTSGDAIMRAVYGDEFAAGYYPLVVLSAAQLINVFCGSTGYLLLMHGHRQVLVASSLISGVLGVVMAFALVPRFGANGVASAFAASICAHQLLMLLIARMRCSVFAFADPSQVISAIRVLRAHLEAR